MKRQFSGSPGMLSISNEKRIFKILELGISHHFFQKIRPKKGGKIENKLKNCCRRFFQNIFCIKKFKAEIGQYKHVL